MSTKETFTPGPWVVRALSYGLGVFKEQPGQHGTTERVLIASIQETSTRHDEPEHAPFDAALIAAGPDLYATLKQLSKAAQNAHYKMTNAEQNKSFQAVNEALAQAASALLKAEKGGV